MNLWSSELAKLAANALLAQRISSINPLSAICEATGANIDEISYAVGLDKRIGPYMLKSSIGFGGSCFKKDVLNLVYLSETLHFPEVAAYWKAVVDLNEWQKDRFAKRVVSSLYNTLSNKKVAISGFAYKKNTGDTRESAAISIVNHLVAERAKVSIYDPQVKAQQIWQDLHYSTDTPSIMDEFVTICDNPYDACADASAIVIVTEWDEFKCAEYSDGVAHPSKGNGAQTDDKGFPFARPTISGDNSETRSITFGPPLPPAYENHKDLSVAKRRVDWQHIAGIMSRPAFVSDGRKITKPAKLRELGFRVECIGSARSGGLGNRCF